ncbi:hypothetical protein MRX96_031708 [Rhipicephalus microplus]
MLENPLQWKVRSLAVEIEEHDGAYVTFTQVCALLNNGAQRLYDDESKVPYLHKEKLWVSYDDQKSVPLKRTLSVEVRSLAGAGGGSVLGVALRVCAVNLGLRSDGAPIRALQKLFGGDILPVHLDFHCFWAKKAPASEETLSASRRLAGFRERWAKGARVENLSNPAKSLFPP